MIPAPRPRPPLWLAVPGRYAGLTRPVARRVLLALVVFLAATLTALSVPVAPPAASSGGQADVVLYGAIVEGVRHGGNYYQVAADALRAGDYPLRPFVTFRLPTLAIVEAAIPPVAVQLLLDLLVAGVGLAWFARLRPVLSRPLPRVAALLLLAAGLVVAVQPGMALFHETWAGLLIALSLAVRQRGRWIEAVALGCTAALIRETAALYLLVMAAFAWRDGEHEGGREGSRHETLGWLAALAVLVPVVLVHAHAVAGVVRPLDPVSPGWAGMLGLGHFVRTVSVSTALTLLPLWLAAPLVGLAVWGWSGWRDAVGPRVVATIGAYAVLLAVWGRADTFYWGLLVTPVLLVGLVFVPDAIRDLVHAGLDRRRITVTRLGRMDPTRPIDPIR